MPKAIVIADDFTGANAIGVLLKKNGLKATSFLNYEQVSNYQGSSDVDKLSSSAKDRCRKGPKNSSSLIYSHRYRQTAKQQNNSFYPIV